MTTDESAQESLLVAGQIGWDDTDIDGERRVVPGGSLLHFVRASLAVGLAPVLSGYGPSGALASELALLNRHGALVDHIVDTGREPVVFHLSYRDGEFVDQRFSMSLPDKGPSLLETSIAHCPPASEIHICTLPSSHLSEIAALVDSYASVSLQVHISQLKDSLSAYRRLVQSADYVFASRSEFLLLVGSDTLSSAVSSAIDEPTTWYVTDPDGVLLVASGRARRFRSREISARDPTAAGDVFAGACTAHRVLTGDLEAAVRVGMAIASMSVLDRSSNGVARSLDPESM